ncbi:FAD-dependent 2-octaprenylphenol hydroxylase [Plesiomonas shigelloides]|uniref:FAD-dependent 2-octaprenylphenol hydroxylase n=1 Tax=Plesiomonas shigelloides TaxID=703 RepID=UPI001C5AE6A7|nr:FAD-dependent 2-octaprenylphenol hydroxylase [Plesiomonas shigelloides]MBW3791971.1 FAD-dependent 2-octaprenylphenol hydroxylase [Plesiomonas shigelloides]
MQAYDVVIIGGGMVGLTVAAALHDSGLRLAVLEGQLPPSTLPAQPDVRVSAINLASQNILQRLGVWSAIMARRSTPYAKMEVWEQDSFGRIAFAANEINAPHLGHIIENSVIQQALWEHVSRLEGVTLLAPAQLKQAAFGENEAFLTLDDGQMLTTRLLVGADGAHSWLRQQADIPLTFWDYGHSALVANIRVAEGHENCARQIFRPQGPLAFLPLSEPNLCSIVWSLPPQEAAQLQALPAEQFNAQLSAAFDLRLGLCELVSERQVIPLTARYARSFAAHRVALVGDAAHTIHPLAGLGVNLGLQDAAALAQEIVRLHQSGRDIGLHAHLRRYERWRKSEAALMLAAMQGFRDLFAGDNPAKKLLRDVGLVLASQLPGVKPQLIRHACGLSGELPQLARP